MTGAEAVDGAPASASDVNPSDAPVTIAIIGAGNRGADVYAEGCAKHPDLARIVAVAEPDPEKRQRFALRHRLGAGAVHATWQDLFGGGRVANAVVIATPDAEHVAPAKAALALGYDVLLEKPIAPTLEGVRELARFEATARGRVTVAHVLRHAPFFATLKALVASGRIGDLVQVVHTENVGYWHFAHSYVRGNWRKEADASPMLLAKACHDLDLIRWLVDRPCERVASFGGLHHFRTANAPVGSTERCLDGCAVERACPYSARRIYLERFGGEARWPNTVVVADPTPERVERALRSGPYGRCVYRCDNDVADHQTVALSFQGGVVAALVVSAFTEANTRTVHLMGTNGEIHGAMEHGDLEVHDFATGSTERVSVAAEEGHRGADEALLLDFLARVRRPTSGRAPTSLGVSIESHLMAFAAEEARQARVGVAPTDLAPPST